MNEILSSKAEVQRPKTSGAPLITGQPIRTMIISELQKSPTRAIKEIEEQV